MSLDAVEDGGEQRIHLGGRTIGDEPHGVDTLPHHHADHITGHPGR